MQSDKRKNQRRPLRHQAWIAIDDVQQIPCLLSDISDSGARIDVAGPEKIPDQFVLKLAAQNAPLRFCKVVWREDKQIGVHFERRQPAVTAPPTKGRRNKDTNTAPPLVPDNAPTDAPAKASEIASKD